MLANLKKEKGLTRGIIEIINELLTTLVYKAPSTVTEWEAAIFIRTLIQWTNRFERASTSGEVAKLISIYTIIPKEDNLQESAGTPKFTKASNWPLAKTPEPVNKSSSSKTPDSRTFSWNTLGIPENTSGINFLLLNEKESNPWTPLVIGKLISPPGTPDMRTPIIKYKTPEDNTDRSLRNLYEETSDLRFRSDIEDNPFWSSEKNRAPVLSTFPTWKLTEDIYYYNILKNKGLVKWKVTFGQTIITPLSNLLSGKPPRYQIRYQTRNNNSPEESSDDDNDNDDNDDNNSN